MIDAFETLICVDSDVMRVVGPAPIGEFVEIVLDEAPLRKAMVEFSIRILLLSLLISAITAALVYLALARAAGAADAAHDRQDGRVPRRPGESSAHYRGV